MKTFGKWFEIKIFILVFPLGEICCGLRVAARVLVLGRRIHSPGIDGEQV